MVIILNDDDDDDDDDQSSLKNEKHNWSITKIISIPSLESIPVGWVWDLEFFPLDSVFIEWFIQESNHSIGLIPKWFQYLFYNFILLQFEINTFVSEFGGLTFRFKSLSLYNLDWVLRRKKNNAERKTELLRRDFNRRETRMIREKNKIKKVDPTKSKWNELSLMNGNGNGAKNKDFFYPVPNKKKWTA